MAYLDFGLVSSSWELYSSQFSLLEDILMWNEKATILQRCNWCNKSVIFPQWFNPLQIDQPKENDPGKQYYYKIALPSWYYM